MTLMLHHTLTRTAIFLAATLAALVHAGPLEDGLLAGAAARLDPKGVEIAIRRGAKVAQNLPHPDAPGVLRTPVQFALLELTTNSEPDAPKRAEAILRALFKAGATLTGDDDELFPVITNGHVGLVRLLLDHGANPHKRIYGYTLAELAIKYEQPNVLPVLYSRGVPKVDAAQAAQIQLVQAANLQNLQGVRAAVALGANVNAPDPAGSYALVQVFSMPLIDPEGYEVVMWLLFDAGADASVTDSSYKKSTALHGVIARNSYRPTDQAMTSPIVALLLRRGADVSSTDYLGRTPLHYAAERGNIHAMQVLLEGGAKVMARDDRGKTPLDLAKSGEAIALLRVAGARE